LSPFMSKTSVSFVHHHTKANSCVEFTTRTSLGETGPLSQGLQARRKAHRIHCLNGMEVRKKMPRGLKKEAQGVQVSPLSPLSVAPWHQPPGVVGGEELGEGVLPPLPAPGTAVSGC
jgi:hypothetical protein